MNLVSTLKNLYPGTTCQLKNDKTRVPIPSVTGVGGYISWGVN